MIGGWAEFVIEGMFVALLGAGIWLGIRHLAGQRGTERIPAPPTVAGQPDSTTGRRWTKRRVALVVVLALVSSTVGLLATPMLIARAALFRLPVSEPANPCVSADRGKLRSILGNASVELHDSSDSQGFTAGCVIRGGPRDVFAVILLIRDREGSALGTDKRFAAHCRGMASDRLPSLDHPDHPDVRSCGAATTTDEGTKVDYKILVYDDLLSIQYGEESRDADGTTERAERAARLLVRASS